MPGGHRFAALLLAMAMACAPQTFGVARSAEQNAGEAGDGAAVSGAKLNDYIKGYNTLIGSFGLQEQYNAYLGQQVSRKTVKDSVTLSEGWMDGALDDLKAARAAPDGGLADLDSAGDKLIANLERLVGRLKSLKSYYQSRANVEDGFVRGKREDPLVIEDFKQSAATLAALSGALEAAIEKRDEAGLAALRNSGDLIGYHGGLALQKSKALIELLSSAKDLRNPELIKRGDALAAEIAKAVEETRKSLGAKPAGISAHDLRDSMYDDVVNSLEVLVGEYRDMKRSGSPSYYSAMVANYNEAVDHANLGRH